MTKPKKMKKKADLAVTGASAEDRDEGTTSSKPLAASSLSLRKDSARKAKALRPGGLKDRAAGVVQSISQYVREVRVELSKVTWPSRRDTLASTSVVLIIVILIAIFLGIVDLGLSRILKIVLS
jgi:preprotein translocase subunit SecE